MSGFNVQKEAGTLDSGSSTPKLPEPHKNWEGTQRIYRFPNGFGASVIKAVSRGLDWFSGSYGANSGLWELAVLEFTGPNTADDFELTYDTDITDNVVGHLTEDDVTALLVRIADLPGSANPEPATVADSDALLPNKENDLGTESQGGCC